MPDSLWIDDHPGPRADDPLVVLVHGSMDRSASFARVVRELGDLHVVRYDRRGYGRSRTAGPATIQGHVDDLLAILDGRPATVAAHSLGGVIALAAAQREPDVVRSVMVFEMPMMWAPWWPTDTAAAAAVAADAADAAEAFLCRMIGTDAWEALPARTRADRRAEGPALVAELVSARTPPPPFDPEKIRVPVVVGRGSEAKEQHVRGCATLASALNADIHLIDGATHGAHRSHPAEFASLVRLAVTGTVSGR